MKEQDLPGLTALYRQFWEGHYASGPMEQIFMRLKQNPDYLFLVAEKTGPKTVQQIIGSLMGTVCYSLYGDCRPFLVVEDVIVDAGHRRMGVGSALMKEIERFANRRDCCYILLVTDSDRTAARRFYASLGYDPDTHKGFKKRLRDNGRSHRNGNGSAESRL